MKNFFKSLFCKTAISALAGAMVLGVGFQAEAGQQPLSFKMVVSAGAAKCLPYATARVTLSQYGENQRLHIETAGLPKNTGFDFFVIQDPVAPFGLSWYQGDVTTNASGNGSTDFLGIFSIETFIVAPGVAAAPVVFHNAFPDVSSNPATGPVHEYHLGLWFSDPRDAVKAGCAGTVTPFNGTHNAGIQVLNTSNFPLLAGPLRYFTP